MARRIVVLSPRKSADESCRCVEIHADDASALISSRMVRAEVTKRGGRLYDAMTLTFTEDYITKVAAKLGKQVFDRKGLDYDDEVYESAFVGLTSLCRVVEDFTVPTPIPFV